MTRLEKNSCARRKHSSKTFHVHLHTPQRSSATNLVLTEGDIPEAVNDFELRERA